MGTFSKTEYVNNQVEVELKPAKGFQSRKYLFIQNRSANDIYINQGTHAKANQGTVLAAGLFYERWVNPPQGQIYVSGSIAAPAVQEIGIDEEFI
jgi:hypothetical protein